jgi:hypothetical protein
MTTGSWWTALRSTGAAGLLLASSPANAGGMFHGVRCGEGATTDEAVTTLNERMDQGSYADAVHSSLTFLRHGDRTLACVLVNRQLGDLEKPRVKCQTRSWRDLAENRYGYYFEEDRGGWLTSLTLTVSEGERGPQVTACSLAQPTKP